MKKKDSKLPIWRLLLKILAIPVLLFGCFMSGLSFQEYMNGKDLGGMLFLDILFGVVPTLLAFWMFVGTLKTNWFKYRVWRFYWLVSFAIPLIYINGLDGQSNRKMEFLDSLSTLWYEGFSNIYMIIFYFGSLVGLSGFLVRLTFFSYPTRKKLFFDIKLAAVLTLASLIVSAIFINDYKYIDAEKLYVHSAIGKPVSVKWNEVKKIEVDMRAFRLARKENLNVLLTFRTKNDDLRFAFPATSDDIMTASEVLDYAKAHSKSSIAFKKLSESEEKMIDRQEFSVRSSINMLWNYQ